MDWDEAGPGAAGRGAGNNGVSRELVEVIVRSLELAGREWGIYSEGSREPLKASIQKSSRTILPR